MVSEVGIRLFGIWILHHKLGMLSLGKGINEETNYKFINSY